jgi:SnoaL-like domain
MTDEDALHELMAKQQIIDAMARYARGIDRRDEALVRSAYHEDSIDHHGFGMDAPGWQLAAMVRRDGTGFPTEWTITTHLLGQHYIEVDGDTAKSEVYYEFTARMHDPDGTEWRLTNSGRYLDRWLRRDNAFRIIERTVLYDGEVHTEPVRTNWPGPDHQVPKVVWGGQEVPFAETVMGTGGPDDPSYQFFAADPR